jgi:hypothetical protein
LYSWHTFEHVTNFMQLMEEVYRICAVNARITIVVPHHSNGFGYSDPTHVRFFGLYSMSYFVAKDRQPFSRKVRDFYSAASFDLVHVKIEFYRMRGIFEKWFASHFNGWSTHRPVALSSMRGTCADSFLPGNFASSCPR